MEDIFDSDLRYVGVDCVVSKEEDDVGVEIVVEDDVVTDIVAGVVVADKVAVEETVVVEGTSVVEVGVEHKIGLGIHLP